MPESVQPIVELVSPPAAHHPAGAGKTALLYLIIARAILPSNISQATSSIGQNAAIMLFDPLNHFSVPRLTEVMLAFLLLRIRTANQEMDETTIVTLKTTIKRSLIHVHLFRSQSWSAMLATLRSLPRYLLDANRHMSMHRRVHSIIVEDIDTFTGSIRSSSSDAPVHTNPLITASAQLTAQLNKLSNLFSCATILTSQSTTPSAYRTAIPTSWPPGSAVVRLAVRRVEVVHFAPAISVEEAERERQQRWEVVSRAQFESWKVGASMKDGNGFVFRVGKGVEIETAK